MSKKLRELLEVKDYENFLNEVFIIDMDGNYLEINKEEVKELISTIFDLILNKKYEILHYQRNVIYLFFINLVMQDKDIKDYISKEELLKIINVTRNIEGLDDESYNYIIDCLTTYNIEKGTKNKEIEKLVVDSLLNKNTLMYFLKPSSGSLIYKNEDADDYIVEILCNIIKTYDDPEFLDNLLNTIINKKYIDTILDCNKILKRKFVERNI